MSREDDLDRRSLLALFREEAGTQTRVLCDGLIALEHAPADAAQLEACMRAAHSLKGAARIVGLQDGVDIAHLMEECFVAAQRGAQTLSAEHIDALLGGVDLLLRAGEPGSAAAPARDEIEAFAARLSRIGADAGAVPAAHGHAVAQADPSDDENGDATMRAALAILGAEAATLPPADPPASVPSRHARDPERMLRVRADNLDKMLGLSGESLVESRRLKPFADALLRIKRTQRAAALALDHCYETLAQRLDAQSLAKLDTVRQTFGATQHLLATRIDELDRFDRRSTNLAQQLYDEALQCRMRPFGDATRAYPRIVRDLARTLGKQVRFSVLGEATRVDRDILDRLDAPLGHLLRNALDHGIETPGARAARGKPAEATLALEARHSAGKLLISVSDDGAGIDLDALRAAIVERRLADAGTAARLSEHELLDFLLLPGFSMRAHVTDVSGRGVGLDAVHEMVKAVRGSIQIHTEPDRGTRFVLQLPLTLSVVRSLLVQVGGEAYAFPLAHVRHTLELARSDIDTLEGQHHFGFDGRPTALVTAHQLLGTPASDEARETVAVVVIGDDRNAVGIAVDRFIDEQMLVVQPLDSRLGKIKDIAAGALMDNGEAVLIVDVDDVLRSVDKLVRDGRIDKMQRNRDAADRPRKHVLVIEDSLTVRELERKLLEKRGYEVTVAVDGIDGWNALRTTQFDLVVTDIDMPRMDGIELVALIRRDAQLKSVPVMIVSYKDRDEDRRRGLEAGADYYLAKGSFHDETLLDAVRDLIGEAQP